MSFYLGTNPDTGKKIMVATSATNTIEELQIANPIECEFHSDLPVLAYKRFDATVTDYGYITHRTGYLFSETSSPTYNVVIASFPMEFFNYVDRQLVVIVDNELTLSNFTTLFGLRNKIEQGYKFGQKWVDFLPTYDPTNYPNYYPQSVPSTTWKYLLVPKRAVNPANRNLNDPYTVPDVAVLVTNYKLDGTYVPPVDPSNYSGIIMDNSSIIINGYNLFDLNYMSNVSMSSADVPIASEGGNLYLVGEDDSLVGTGILSAPNRTRMYKGNNVLFDTLYGRRGQMYAGKYTGTKSYVVPYGMEWGEEFDLIHYNLGNIGVSPKINVMVQVTITSTNIKHNNSNISNYADIEYYGVRTYGAMFFVLESLNTEYLVGHDEYTYHYNPSTVVTFPFIRVYIMKKLGDFGNGARLTLVARSNQVFTNSSAKLYKHNSLYRY